MKNQTFPARLGFALNGIKSALKREASFQIQIAAAVLVLVFLAVCGASAQWWALIVLCVGIVLTAEMFNTALEHMIDHLHPARHPAIGLAKDCAAGAVLISSVMAVAVFLAFLWHRFEA